MPNHEKPRACNGVVPTSKDTQSGKQIEIGGNGRLQKRNAVRHLLDLFDENGGCISFKPDIVVHAELEVSEENLTDRDSLRIEALKDFHVANLCRLDADCEVIITPFSVFKNIKIDIEHVARTITNEDKPEPSTNLNFHFYAVHNILPESTNNPKAEEEDEEPMPASTKWQLPSRAFVGLWESLIFEEGIKQKLINYCSTALLFAESDVDPTLITWNRVVLLHGPPGTGKTTFCKALAQKICIRHSRRYKNGVFIEINAHSLFSKWFSESGKLVMKMFQQIEHLVKDPKQLVFILLDEVESLTAARKCALGGTEPSDAIRVVNALLGQLDHIRQYPNVMVLATSNITGAIDLAFLDRADIKQYIGPPSVPAIYTILHSCILELTRKRLIIGDVLPRYSDILKRSAEDSSKVEKNEQLFLEIARSCSGFSGRALRKLPFLAFALQGANNTQITCQQFLQCMKNAVDVQNQERKDLQKENLI